MVQVAGEAGWTWTGNGGERRPGKPLYSFIRACVRVSPGGQALYQAASMPGLGEARPIWGGAGTVQGAVLAQEAHP